MTNKPSGKDSPAKPADDVTVPRDRHVDTGEGPVMPAPNGERMRDEDYTDRDKPLVSGSVEAKRLQSHPPKGKGQLGTGTAGDAGRPTKEGIYGKPIPPRGHL